LRFRSVNPLPLLRAVRDHEGLARGRMIAMRCPLQTLGQLRLVLLPLQLCEWTCRLLLFRELRRRRILMIFLLRKDPLLNKRLVTLLLRDFDAEMHVVIAVDRHLLALLCTLLELEQG
jgi:hypothetical protein